MIFPVLGQLLPSLIATLFAVGCLAAILRSGNPVHSLFGIAIMGLSPLLFLAGVDARQSVPESGILTVSLGFTLCFSLIAGLFLFRSEADR